MTAQSSYPRTGQRPGAATSGVKVAHWNGTENLPRDARNVNALDIITRLDALRGPLNPRTRAHFRARVSPSACPSTSTSTRSKP